MNSEALPFSPPALADAARICPVVAAAQSMANDLSFANLYLLRHKYQTTVAVENDMLFRHYGGSGRLQGYSFPCGHGNMETALQRIETDAALRQRPLRFCLLTPQDAALLQTLRPGQFTFTWDAGDSDYIYRQSDLSSLPGTAYHRKRNHIARFEKLFPDWRFEVLTPAHAPEALAVAREWLAASPGTALEHELHAIGHALQHTAGLGICGGLIYTGGRAVAMALASFISPRVADVHYEKCLPGYREAYPVINRELARILDCDWINREEDLNQPGLRHAKESYRPALLLTKQSATPC